MKRLFDTLPEALVPHEPLDTGLDDLPLLPPDDDDVIRPDAENALSSVSRKGGALVHVSNPRMGKHLLWTFGPLHRDLPFMLQLRAEIDGDRFVAVDPEIGWLHQGLEKTLEQTAPDEAFAVLCALGPEDSVAYDIAYTLAIEALLGLSDEVAGDVLRFRVVLLELSRIRAHLQVLSDLARAHSDLRAEAALAQSMNTVAGLLRSLPLRDDYVLHHAVGGLAGTLPRKALENLSQSLTAALAPAQATAQLLMQTPAFVDGLGGLGPVGRDEAIALGLSGPALRATGVADDVRTRAPYLTYADVAPQVCTREAGDALARFGVRLDELATSAATVVRSVQKMDGEELTAAPQVGKASLSGAGQAAVSIEAPSGELSVVVSCGEEGIERVRVRGPSFPLAAALGPMLAGARLDDAMTVLSSLGISGPELDR